MKTFLRIIVIAAILLILIFLSIGIVKVVPKAISSLASATVSIGSIFDGIGGKSATTTVTDANGSNSTNNGTVISNGNGFIVVGSSTSGTNSGNTSGTGNTSTSTSLLDLLNPKFGSYPYNNYVPTPATSTYSNGANSGAYTNTNSGTKTNTSSNTSTGSYTRTTSCVSGAQPDLAVSILSRGVISKTTGQYIETNNFTTGDTVSIKFKVENRGLCSTGTWNFRADMPSNNAADQVRNVNGVASIPAGAAVTGQANFDSPRAGNSNVVFTVTDTSGRDGNTSNNTVSTTLNVVNNGTGSNGGNGVITSGDGRADLAVRVVQMGVLTYNNQFVPMTTYGSTYGGNFRSGDRVAVKFEVVNQGNSASGIWNFRADLTDNPTKMYENPNYEASIPAGGKTTYTIAFDNVRTGTNTITIYADNRNQVNEFNESNNTASVGFNVSY